MTLQVEPTAEPPPGVAEGSLHGRHATEAGGDAWTGLLVDGRYELHATHPTDELCWAGHDHVLNRPVALRASGVRESSQQELVAEGRRAAVVEHPGLLRVHDVTLWQDRVWLVTELLGGRTLAQYLDRGEVWDEAAAKRIGDRIASALAALHRAGLVHGAVLADTVVLDDARGPVLARFPEPPAELATPAADLAALADLLTRLTAPAPPTLPFDDLVRAA